MSGPFGVDVVPLVEILDLKEDTNWFKPKMEEMIVKATIKESAIKLFAQQIDLINYLNILCKYLPCQKS